MDFFHPIAGSFLDKTLILKQRVGEVILKTSIIVLLALLRITTLQIKTPSYIEGGICGTFDVPH